MINGKVHYVETLSQVVKISNLKNINFAGEDVNAIGRFLYFKKVGKKKSLCLKGWKPDLHHLIYPFVMDRILL